MTTLRIFTLLLALLAPIAWAFEPVVGTEILLTDSDGEHLLGYGLVTEQGLVLDVVSGADRFTMLVVGPDGNFEMLVGEVAADGRVRMVGDDGAPFDLAERLAEADISFELRRVAGGDRDDDDHDDDNRGPGNDDRPDDGDDGDDPDDGDDDDDPDDGDDDPDDGDDGDDPDGPDDDDDPDDGDDGNRGPGGDDDDDDDSGSD